MQATELTLDAVIAQSARRRVFEAVETDGGRPARGRVRRGETRWLSPSS